MNFLHRLGQDERGGEVREYAMIAGPIIVAAIGAITTIGNKVLARRQSLVCSM